MNPKIFGARLRSDVALLVSQLFSGIGAYVLLAIGVVLLLALAFIGGLAVIWVVPALLLIAALVLGVAVALRPISPPARQWLAGRPIRRVATRSGVRLGRALGAVALWWLLACRTVARRARRRIGAHRETAVPIAYRPLPDGRTATLRVVAADPATWRDLTYLAVGPAYALLACVAVVGVVIGVVALIAGVPSTGTPAIPWWEQPWAWLMAAAGVALLLAAPFFVHGLARGGAALGAALLSTGEGARMRAELEEQRLRRQLAVDAAERERRRIERDLHDGAQQRLVALGMSLGLARETLPTDPAAGAALVAEAHAEAKLALAELRDLARGIHPAILTDRGLDAALSELLRRSRVPVSIFVTLPNRPPTTVESAAYFVVAEALANVSRHAAASRATVNLSEVGGCVAIEVTDDGIGGADPAAGTGLRGLAERVSALGGRLTVDSPAGGPTTIRAVIPCGS